MLGVSSSGFLTIVETKLHRNPQSRREVLGQILDYCSQLSSWSYDKLVEAVSSAKHRANDAADPLVTAAKGPNVSASDQTRFRATVTEGLRHGRFLMLIVGDGFRDSTQHLVDFVEKFMHLQFTVRLVELQLFRPAGTKEYPVLVVPRVTARTQEVTRAIVRLQHNVNPADVVIEGIKPQVTTPGLEGFVEVLRKTSPVADRFAEFVGGLAPLQIYPDPTKDGISLRFPDPNGSGQQFRILRVRRNGHARVGRLKGQLEKQGYSVEPAVKYLNMIASWLPGTTVGDTGELYGPNGRAKEIPLTVLLRDHADEYALLVRRLLDEIRAVGAEVQKG
jgi:hypothetical protein